MRLSRHFRAGLSHAAATRLNLGRPKRRGTPAQALKPALLHASDAALKGPLFHGAADLYSAIDITPFSTSDHPRHPTLEITLPKSHASVTIQSQHHSLRLEAYALPEFGGVIHGAVGDYVFDVAGVVNVLERVAVDQDQVGALSGFDRAQFLVEAHDAGRHRCRCLDRFQGSESRLHVEFELAIEAVSRNGLICAGYDGNSGPMQAADDCHFLLEDFFSHLGVLVWRLDIGELPG